MPFFFGVYIYGNINICTNSSRCIHRMHGKKEEFHLMKLTPTFMSTLDVHFDRTLLWLQTFSTAINYTNSHFVRSNSHTRSLAHTFHFAPESDREFRYHRPNKHITSIYNGLLYYYRPQPLHSTNTHTYKTNRATEGAIIVTDFGLKVFPNIFIVFISIAFNGTTGI